MTHYTVVDVKLGDNGMLSVEYTPMVLLLALMYVCFVLDSHCSLAPTAVSDSMDPSGVIQQLLRPADTCVMVSPQYPYSLTPFLGCKGRYIRWFNTSSLGTLDIDSLTGKPPVLQRLACKEYTYKKFVDSSTSLVYCLQRLEISFKVFSWN